MNVLVLNCFSRNALAVINALGPNSNLIGGHSIKGLASRACEHFKSQYLDHLQYISEPSEESDAFVTDVIACVEQFGIDVVVPTGTTYTDSLSLNKVRIESETKARMGVEDFEKLQQLTDKWLAYEMCLSLGVPVPKSVLIPDRASLAKAVEKEELRYPVVLKPTRSFASIGVELFDDKSQAESFLASGRSLALDTYVNILQEKIEGDLHDVTACGHKGEPVSMLSQARLMTWYDFGGGGIINETTDNPYIKEHAKRILKHLGWNGVMLFDFIIDRYGQPYLLECNPKIWGTTQLTVDAGLNMPLQLVNIFTRQEPPVYDAYAVGMRYVWIFPYCLASIFNRPRTARAMLARMGRIAGLLPGSKNNVTKKNLLHLFGTVVSRVAL